jgi:hypothetical protein
VLEKMKRKISTDSPLYYDKPHEAVTRLNELYSRFVRYRNVDKKPYVSNQLPMYYEPCDV